MFPKLSLMYLYPNFICILTVYYGQNQISTQISSLNPSKEMTMKDEIPTVTISKKIKNKDNKDPQNVWEPGSQEQKRKILC